MPENTNFSEALHLKRNVAILVIQEGKEKTNTYLPMPLDVEVEI